MATKVPGTPRGKVVKNYDYGLAGIPVIISQVTMRPYHDDWYADINHFEVHRIIAKNLCTKDTRLSGNEVRFLRQWLSLNMASFASAFDYTAPAIHKWERKGSKPAGMMWSAEVQLRLLMLDHLGVSATAFISAFRDLVKPLPEGEEQPLLIDGKAVKPKNRPLSKPAPQHFQQKRAA